MQANQSSEQSNTPFTSPFSDAENHVSQKRHESRTVLWISLTVVFCVSVALGGFFFLQHLNDPFRTLEVFPVGKYMESYKPLMGSKFRGDLRVENDLGWKENIGRLMAFSSQSDLRPIIVMIPPELAGDYFTKGQNLVGELEVKEGGLIYANSIRKN